jgi:hypothetical protein
MKMKKIVFYFVLITGIAAFLSSCSSTYSMVVDKNSPADQNVTVTFDNSTKNGYFLLREWNNSGIKDELYTDKGISSNDKVELIVPAGMTSFTFDVFFTISNRYSSTTYSFKDIELRYNLEPGKEYLIKGDSTLIGLIKGFEFSIRIYDAAGSTLLREWKLN